MNYIQRQFASVTYPPIGVGDIPVQRRLRRRSYPRLSGLGAATATGTAASIAAAGAQTTAGIMAGLTATLGSAASTGGISAAISGAIELGTLIYNLVQGCGETCTEATSLVNQAEPLLQQNLDNYLAAQAAGANYASVQAAGENNFNTVWASLTQACETAGLNTAGQNCIADRQNGACYYKTSPGGWQQSSSGVWTYARPGANGSGSTCWNWFVGYYDPIANDPTVIPDPVAGASTAGTTGSAASPASNVATSASPLPLVLLAAALLILFVD